MARNAGLMVASALCLALVAAAALAAGGLVQEAHAQRGGPLELEALGQLRDGGNRELDGAAGVDVFEKGGRVYAVVAGFGDHGIQIVDLTDPGAPTSAGRLGDSSDDRVQLRDPRGVEVFETGGTTYAAVVGKDDAVQVIDLSDPTSPGYAGSLLDTSELLLADSFRAAVFERNGLTYLAVPSPTDHGLQTVHVNVNFAPVGIVGQVGDNDDRLLRGASGVDVFERDGRTYAVVASSGDDGIQLVDVTNPNRPVAAGKIGELYDTPDVRELDGAFNVAVFETGGRHYAAVTGHQDNGLQIVDVTDPNRLLGVGRLADIDELRLRGPTGIDAFRIGAYSYVAVASDEDALQIVDVTDPSQPIGAGKLTDGGSRLLSNTNDVKVYKRGDSHYAAVTSFAEDGIQIVRLKHQDDSPPDIVSAALDVYTGIMTLAFDETIDVSETDLSRIYVEGAGIPRVALDGAAFDYDASDSAALSLTLTESQVRQIAPATAAPQIRIDGAAVHDLAANTWGSTQNAPITVTSSDTEKPVITLRGDRSVTVELGGTYTEQGASVSDNDPAYETTEATAGGDTVDAGTAGVYTVTYTAPADGAGNAPDPVSRTVTVGDLTPPSLVSATFDPGTDVLTVVFDEPIDPAHSTVGVSAGGAELQSDFDVDPSSPDTLTHATLPPDILRALENTGGSVYLHSGSVADVNGNFASHTSDFPITVTAPSDVTPPSFVSATLDQGTRILTVTFDEDVDVSETVTRDILVSLNAPGLSEHTVSSLLAGFDRSAPDSDTLAFTLDGRVDGAVSMTLDFYAGSVKDLAGNGISRSTGNAVTVLRPPPGPVDPPGQACAPPSSGHWDVRDSCALESDARASAGITVHAPAVLYIPAGVTLDVDLARHGLLVKQGAGLLIQHGGGMR